MMTEQDADFNAIVGPVGVELERRELRRWRCDWPAKYSIDSEHYEDVRITNGSVGGFGLSLVVPVEIGDRITILAEDIGTFTCRLAWKGEASCGVEILNSVDSLSSSQIDALADALIDATGVDY